MTGTSSTGLVANPLYNALHALYTQVQGDAATMRDALKAADQQMAAGATWVGPAAQSWGSELSGRSRDCATQVNTMLADIEAALQGEPAEVTAQVAEQKARLMMLMRDNY